MDERSTHTDPSAETERFEEEDARRQGQADRMPTPEEEAVADEQPASPEAAEHYREMAERGARQKGEGRIE
jgi:hypothetical protein